MKSGDTQGHHLSFSQRSKGGGDVYQLSFPIVMFATIFLSTVLRFVNFLSLLSAASSSARNSCGHASQHGHLHATLQHVSAAVIAHLDLSPLEELGILAWGRHGECRRGRRSGRER